MANEVDKIIEAIKSKTNFLLSGGAGSGKTYTLIEVIKKIYQDKKNAKVACITFTNVAADEIKQRAPFKNLHVSTIHDFLWSCISNFQTNIKKSLVELIENESIRYSGDLNLDLDYYKDKKIIYREWKSLESGTISHDEVIKLAEKMFSDYPLLSDILKDKFEYIFIDEYQDTFIEVINIFLRQLENSKKENVIGLFGDSMQSIYPNGVGSVDEFVEQGSLLEIVKPDNRRNPKNIIELINQIRNDNLIQTQAEDIESPNYGKEGCVNFIYQESNDYDVEEIKELDVFEEFDFNDVKETKELYLVHNLISDKAGFSRLMEVYDKDRILDYAKRIKKHIDNEGLDINLNQSFRDIYNENLKAPTPTQLSYINGNQDHLELSFDYNFSDLLSIYLDKDQLIGQKNSNDDNRGNRADNLINHLTNIQDCIFLYENKMFNDFIKKTRFEITSIEDKEELKKSIDELVSSRDKSIEYVIEFSHEKNIWNKDDNFRKFLETKEYVYKRVKDIPYSQFVNLYNYLKDYSPYSTQHNIKGAEFDNVFVVLDNGGWNHYNFTYLFENSGRDTVINRTRKLFYVCCSRAKNNLVVLFTNPSDQVLNQANEWFGEDNVHMISRESSQ